MGDPSRSRSFECDTTFSRLQTRVATGAEDMRKIAQLRYDVYVREQGKNYPEADHSARALADDLDECGGKTVQFLVEQATSVAGLIEKKLVGAVRFSHFDDDRAYAQYVRLFDLQRFITKWPRHSMGVCSRLVVQDGVRGGRVTAEIFRTLYQYWSWS